MFWVAGSVFRVATFCCVLGGGALPCSGWRCSAVFRVAALCALGGIRAQRKATCQGFYLTN